MLSVPNYKFMFSLVVLCVRFDSVSHKQNNPSLCKCTASLQVCTQTANWIGVVNMSRGVVNMPRGVAARGIR